MFFFLNDPPTPEIYTLPHHPPLPITYASADPPITYPADLRSLWSFFIVINSQYSYTLYDPLQTFRHSPRLYLLPDGCGRLGNHFVHLHLQWRQHRGDDRPRLDLLRGFLPYPQRHSPAAGLPPFPAPAHPFGLPPTVDKPAGEPFLRHYIHISSGQ